ncbi:sugar transferase [Salimicrobium flavidum]|uniref:Sugar transferase involved in LPS biosynthesis (Colanic, teichoic acid) n=1 Tax=Salimicrobium flavidum TaxID=570947 RepID=A0A1N7KMS8_9BACI|nr:sugar transferase [Salimicrobium flavidum]SIS62895.1 Sugar transferase involved in LPS biosynthesis (colanic, teichoic acid) [Salimicrobium flavidum]
MMLYRKYFKRAMDVILSLFAIIFLSPVLLVVSLLVKKKLGSPVFFRQKRPGLNEKIFTMYKFRTMKDKKDEQGKLLSDKERLDSFGKTLRATSVDELPELFNILKGDMSIIGPRPLLIEYLDLYNDKQRKRHSVRPGLSGLAQVSGRNAISWDEKFKKDVEYAENVSFMMDCKLILLTVLKVAKREGVNSSGDVTMEKFRGNG